MSKRHKSFAISRSAEFPYWIGINKIWSRLWFQSRLYLEQNTGIRGLCSQAGESLFRLTEIMLTASVLGVWQKGSRETFSFPSNILCMYYIYSNSTDCISQWASVTIMVITLCTWIVMAKKGYNSDLIYRLHFLYSGKKIWRPLPYNVKQCSFS